MQEVQSYSEAVEAATKSYWVVPILICANAGHEIKFSQEYRIADECESGLVHYAKRSA